jgi:tetratricopeptide (TPR) repeat protein
MAEAQAYCEEALDAATRNGGVPYIHLATVLNSLGVAAQARGDWELAEQYYQQARQQAPHCPVWAVQDALFGLAQVCLARCDLPQAYTLFVHVAGDRATAAATRAAARRHLHELGVRGMLVQREPVDNPNGYSGGSEQWEV